MKEKIKLFFKGDVDSSAEALASHGRDASLFEILPELVVYPKDAADISNLVKFVVNERRSPSAGGSEISITARSAGTCMSGGSLNNSISLDGMRYLNSIGLVKKVTPYKFLPHFYGAKPVTIAGEMRVQPGVYYRDLEATALKENLLLPCFTASKSINAIGGMIGNNSGGELSLKYGKMQDYVQDVDVVLADGTVETFSEIPRKEAEHRAKDDTFLGRIYRDMLGLLDANKALIESKRPHVSKNSAGYSLWNITRIDPISGDELVDLSQLITGSQGTLGITTGSTLRLVDNVEDDEHSALLVVFMSDLAALGEIVNETLSVNPESVEAYDDKTLKLAVRFWRGFIKKQGLWGAIKLGLSFIPEFRMMFFGMPKIVLLVECAGPHKDEVLARFELLRKKLAKFPGVTSRSIAHKEEAEKYWIIRRDSFALLREHFQGKRTAPFVDDIIVPPATLPTFLPKMQKILDDRKIVYSIAGHAANGNFHIIPLIDLDARLAEKMILEVSEEVYALVLSLGGSITAEHNDGIIRTPFLGDMFGPEMIELFAKVKMIFDPLNIFNPGKKVGLTKGDIGKYLIHGK
jgi:FAD/FMN-containing dehydrogenase